MGLLRGETETEQEILKDIFNTISFEQDELNSLIMRIKEDLSKDEEKINKGMKNDVLAKYLDGLEAGTSGQIISQLLDRLYLSTKESPKNLTKNLQIVGIKEVFCEEYINPFLNYYGSNSAALHIIRDPRAVVASRNYGKYMEATGSKYPIFFIIQSWKRSVEYYLLNQEKDNYLMVRYENLASKPQKVLRLVCEILHMNFTAEMTDFDLFKDSKGNPWQANSSFGNSRAINTASINKWQEILPPEEIELTEYYCQKEMEVLGYKLSCKQFDQQTILNFKEDSSKISNWLRCFNFKKMVLQDFEICRTTLSR